jgi:hypothetical protein
MSIYIYMDYRIRQEAFCALPGRKFRSTSINFDQLHWQYLCARVSRLGDRTCTLPSPYTA